MPVVRNELCCDPECGALVSRRPGTPKGDPILCEECQILIRLGALSAKVDAHIQELGGLGAQVDAEYEARELEIQWAACLEESIGVLFP